MGRTPLVLSSIALGALVTSLGMGITLRQATHDKNALANELTQAQTHIEELTAQQETLLQTSNDRIKELQDALQLQQSSNDRLSLAQRSLTKARYIATPIDRNLRNWGTVASTALGVTFRIPPQSSSSESNGAITVDVTRKNNEHQQWFALAKYSQDNWNAVTATLTNTSTASFLAGTNLYAGIRGTLSNGTPIYVLQTQPTAKESYLIWITPLSEVKEQTALDTLATISFRGEE